MKSALWPRLAALAFVAACSSTSKDEQKRGAVDASAQSPTEPAVDPAQAAEFREEVEIGRGIAAKIAGHFKMLEDEELTAYVNLVGLVLARRSGRPEVTFRFAILDEEEPNALAVPGGFIFVTKGLLRQTANEHELAGILAHEIAHVTERHLFKEIRPKRDVRMTESMVRMMSRGGSDIGYSLGQVVNQGMKLLLEQGLGAEREHEADYVGTFIASTAGYDPWGLHSVLTRIGKTEVASTSKTHPPFPERLKSLRDHLQSQGLAAKSKAKAPALEARFRAAKARIGNAS